MENIVKALNNFVKREYGITGNFVQYRSYTVDRSFKAYKHHKLCLYYVNKGKEYPIIEETVTSTESSEELLTKILNIAFLEAVFDYVASEEFKDLMNGNLGI